MSLKERFYEMEGKAARQEIQRFVLKQHEAPGVLSFISTKPFSTITISQCACLWTLYNGQRIEMCYRLTNAKGTITEN